MATRPRGPRPRRSPPEVELIDMLLHAARSGAFDTVVDPAMSELVGLPGIELGAVAAVLLCMACDDERPLLSIDNLVGDCGSCGRRVQYRPDAPVGAETELECLFCAAFELFQ